MKTSINYFKTENLGGLIFACPFNDALHNCPYNTLRQIEIDDRISFIEKLSNSEIDSFIYYHENCFARRDFLNRKKKSLIKQVALSF
jgi:hypothetical protein